MITIRRTQAPGARSPEVVAALPPGVLVELDRVVCGALRPAPDLADEGLHSLDLSIVIWVSSRLPLPPGPESLFRIGDVVQVTRTGIMKIE
jgi:hypothetical protein